MIFLGVGEALPVTRRDGGIGKKDGKPNGTPGARGRYGSHSHGNWSHVVSFQLWPSIVSSRARTFQAHAYKDGAFRSIFLAHDAMPQDEQHNRGMQRRFETEARAPVRGRGSRNGNVFHGDGNGPGMGTCIDGRRWGSVFLVTELRGEACRGMYLCFTGLSVRTRTVVELCCCWVCNSMSNVYNLV